MLSDFIVEYFVFYKQSSPNLYYPVADGTATAAITDTGLTSAENIPYKHLKLLKVEQLGDDVVWMKYKVQKYKKGRAKSGAAFLRNIRAIKKTLFF